jgi:hypothetical protein
MCTLVHAFMEVGQPALRAKVDARGAVGHVAAHVGVHYVENDHEPQPMGRVNQVPVRDKCRASRLER